MMLEQLDARLQELRQEYETGQRVLADLAARQVELQQTVLRISGGIQVIEELLAAAEPATGNGSVPPVAERTPGSAQPTST